MVVILLLVPSSSSASLTTPTYTTSVSSTPTKYHLTSSYAPPRTPLPTNYHYGSRPYTAHQSKFSTPPDAKRNYSREYVNHVTRINISNDYPQIDGGSGEPEAVVKEGKQTFVLIKISRKTLLTNFSHCNFIVFTQHLTATSTCNPSEEDS